MIFWQVVRMPHRQISHIWRRASRREIASRQIERMALGNEKRLLPRAGGSRAGLLGSLRNLGIFAAILLRVYDPAKLLLQRTAAAQGDSLPILAAAPRRADGDSGSDQ